MKVVLLILVSMTFPIVAFGSGASVYKSKHCSLCHGNNGRSVSALASTIIAGKDTRKIQKYLEKSRAGKHPLHNNNYIKELSDQEIKSLAKYLNNL